MVLDALDAPAARRWAGALLAVLADAREEIDALNVYPVPDGDTGTNLYMTVEAGVAAAADLPPEAPLPDVADAFARGVLLGARGNAGTIFAALVRAWAQVVAETGGIDAAGARRALALADTQAWSAVARPVAGTMLSLSRAAADAARALPADASLDDVVSTAAEAARHALAATPRQLDVLRRAGVVDAGGKGLLLALVVLAHVVTGREDDVVPSDGRRRRTRTAGRPSVDLSWCDDATSDGPGYEVMYLLEADDAAIAALRERLSELGESLVVVGGAGLWHVHVHVDRPGEAVEAAVEVGRPSRIRITSLAGHPQDEASMGATFRGVGESRFVGPTGHLTAGEPAASASPEAVAGLPAAMVVSSGPRRVPAALLACATGPGLATLFVGVGARVIELTEGRALTTARLLDAVREARADAVAVLPNDPEALAAAQAAAAAAREEGLRISVVPTRAQVQGIAAAAVHDPGRLFDDDVVLMSAAAGATRDGALTLVPRPLTGRTSGESSDRTWVGTVAGEALFTASADAGTDAAIGVAIRVVDRLLAGGGELVTLVAGTGAEPALLQGVQTHLARAHAGVEVSVHDGGQEGYPLLIGVE